jgi:hypothetical protein
LDKVGLSKYWAEKKAASRKKENEEAELEARESEISARALKATQNYLKGCYGA